MKVGILTFHNAINYGAVLQAFATQELVRSLGHDVEVIDYHNAEIDRSYDRLRFHLSQMPRKNLYGALKYMLRCALFCFRRRAFELFSKRHLSLGRRFRQSESFSLDGYDVILIGSDQLWNPVLTGGYDDVYWGSFPSDRPVKRVAWSVCMNQTALSEKEKVYIKDHITHFDAVSVRENSLASLLAPYYPGCIRVTPDPTLLLRRSRWEQLCRPVPEKNYIAVYAVVLQEETFQAAQKIAGDTGKSIVYLHAYSESNIRKGHKQASGPKAFLSYLKGADEVVTSSFHGAAFSVIFGKTFYCVEEENKDNIRVRDLLQKMDITPERYDTKGFRVSKCRPDQADLTENVHVKKGLEFLSTCLRER